MKRITPLVFALTTLLGMSASSPAQIVVPNDYTTIQAAVDASRSGGRILIRTGTYVEQVTIKDKSLTLRGEPGATLAPPAVLLQTLLPFTTRRPILAIRNATVHLRGLSFDGLAKGPADLSGVYYLAAGGSVRDCSFTGFRLAELTAEPYLPDAIHVANPEDADKRVREMLIAGNTVRDSVNPISVKGDLETLPATFDPNAVRLKATILNNKFVGPAFGATHIGIISHWGCQTVIVDNDVSGFQGFSASGYAVGILIGDPTSPIPFRHPPSVVAFNRVTDCTLGVVALLANRCHIVANKVTAGAFSFGGIGVSGEKNIIASNRIDMSAFSVGFNAGIVMLGEGLGGPSAPFGYANETLVIRNTIAGATFPIVEETGSSGTRLIRNRILP